MTFMLPFVYNLSVYGGISLMLFFVFLLQKDWLETPSKRILGGILFHFLAFFLAYALLSEDTSTDYLPLLMVLLYTLGPLIYTYVQSVYTKDFRFSKNFFSLFTPALVCGILVLILILLDRNVAYLYVLLALIGVGLVWWYTYLAYHSLSKFRQLIKEEYANPEKYNLAWLTNWLRAFVLLLFLDFLLGLAVSQSIWLQTYLPYNICIYACFLIYLGYQGTLQTSVFLPTRLQGKEEATLEKENNAAPANASYSFFRKEEIAIWTARLEKKVQEEELYREDTLSLRQLAEQMGLKDKHLSDLLNNHLQTNFYEYINQFRVAAFQSAVQAGQAEQFTLLALALQCGFSAKSSFNRIFKQHTGMTPSVYRAKFGPTASTETL